MRTIEIPFELVARHVVCELDCARVLVDTGSPVSFGTPRTLTVVETERELWPALGDLTIDRITEHVRALPEARDAPEGWRLDALVGADLLWGHTVHIDWEERLLRITAPADREPASAPADPLDRLVRTRLTIGERELDAVVDTGAGISYAVPEALAGANTAGMADDFLPGVGPFQAELHEVFAHLPHVGFPARIAAANAGVLRLMRAARAEAIIGTDLLSRMGVSVIDYSGGSGPAGAGERRSRPPELRPSVCCVFGPEDSVYCEPDGSTKSSAEAPSGGVRLDDVKTAR
jgi:hypothetical protein